MFISPHNPCTSFKMYHSLHPSCIFLWVFTLCSHSYSLCLHWPMYGTKVKSIPTSHQSSFQLRYTNHYVIWPENLCMMDWSAKNRDLTNFGSQSVLFGKLLYDVAFISLKWMGSTEMEYLWSQTWSSELT